MSRYRGMHPRTSGSRWNREIVVNDMSMCDLDYVDDNVDEERFGCEVDPRWSND